MRVGSQEVWGITQKRDVIDTSKTYKLRLSTKIDLRRTPPPHRCLRARPRPLYYTYGRGGSNKPTILADAI